MTHTPDSSWPTWRDAVMYRLGYLQATVDLHKMQQQSPKSGDGWAMKLLRRAKAWEERYDLVSWLWAMRHRLAWSLLIAGWWDYLLLLVRLITG